MAGEKSEREVVRVENAQYTDGAGGDTDGAGGHTAGAVRVDNAQYNDGAELHTGGTGGRWIDAYLFGIVDGLVYLCTQF